MNIMPIMPHCLSQKLVHCLYCTIFFVFLPHLTGPMQRISINLNIVEKIIYFSKKIRNLKPFITVIHYTQSDTFSVFISGSAGKYGIKIKSQMF